MNDLELHSIEDFVDEMKRRNMSFIIAWADHLQFNKEDNKEIVWAMDRGGVIPLQITLGRMLSGHIEDVERSARSVNPPEPREA